MNKTSIIFIILVSILSLSLIPASALLVDVNVTGPDFVYNCEDYNYTITTYHTTGGVYNATSISANITLPTGFSTSDPLSYLIPSLTPGQSDQRVIHLRAACDASVGSIVVNGAYNYNTSTVDFNGTKPITVYPGAVTIEKLPSTQNATLENNVSWTIVIRSSGLGPIEDVIVTDTIQSGLLYLSSNPAGVVTGPGALQWTATEIPNLSHMDPNDEVQIQLLARVVGCENLSDTANVTWGCDGGCDTQMTQASIAFQPDPPRIDYTLPSSFLIDYCSAGNTFTIPISNTGGTAYDFNLSADFGSLTVANITSPAGASYSSGKFILGDIPLGTTNLTFDLVPAGGWCVGPLPTGTVIFEPDYMYCSQEFLPPVKFGSYSVQNVPSLSVTKTGAPGQMYLGESITYTISANYSGPPSCGTGTASSITVVDTIPEGFTVSDAGGGSYDGNRTITWTVPSNAPWSSTITIDAPSYSDCEYCYTYATNNVTASVTDCCGCLRTASASQTTALQCSETLSSNKSVSSNYNFEKCTPISYVNEYNFSDSSFWDDVNMSDLIFTEELANGQLLTGQVIIDVNGCSITYTPAPSTPMIIDFSDIDFLASCGFDGNTTSIRSTRLRLEYNLSTQNSSPVSGCANSTFYDWSILDTGAIQPGGGCYESSQQIRETVSLTINGSQLGISMSGLPAIVDRCGTYDVNLTITRSSTVGAYDAEVVFPLGDYHINSISYAGYTPAETNNSPVDFVWSYGDYFATNTQARILLNVTKKCTDAGGMGANLYWDGLCNNDGNYDRECQDTVSQSPLVLRGNVCIMKVPELLWATTNKAAWKLCLTNAGSGAGYTVWVEDILGVGLSYNSSTGTYSQLNIDQDRNGNPINGATWIIDKINAGEKTDIILTANIDRCDTLTNTVSTSAGCLGSDCQDIKTDSATVRIPGSAAQTTNIIPDYINMCDQEPISIIVKNSGLTTIYDVNVAVQMPSDLIYVNGTGNPSDPENISANPLRWTKNQIPGLSQLNASGKPGDSLTITFDVETTCSAPQTGAISSQAFFKTPCGDISNSQSSSSNINRRYPEIDIQKRGRNVATQPAFGTTVVANVSDTVIWRLRLSNNGTAPADVVYLWDVLPANMAFQSINPAPISGSGTAGDPWIIPSINPATTIDYNITANVVACANPLTNVAYVQWGCDDGCTRPADSNSINLRTNPSVSTSVAVASFTTCDGEITISVTNGASRPTAYNVQVTSILPTGFVFDSMISGANPDPFPPADPSRPIWTISSIPGGSTVTLRFRVKDNGTSCDTVTPSTTRVQTIYYNSCGNPITATESSTAVNPTKPNLTVEKSPEVQIVGVTGEASWTITVRNTGGTSATNVTVIDILDPNWDPMTIVASNGSNGEVPSIVGNTITWNVSNPIPGPTGIWTATLSAKLINFAGTGRNDVYVRGRCSTGCTYSSATDTATILNLEGISKTSRKQTATIGEEVIFDIAVNYHGVGSLYGNTLIVDTLPGGLEYMSHTFSETNSSIPHPYTHVDPVVSWMLGTPSGLPGRTFTGPNGVMIALTTRIRDIPGNVNGVTLINPVNTVFIQDGTPGTLSDDANVTIVEPNLTIDKEGNVTAALPGQSIHYTITITNNGTSPAYDVIIQDVVPDGLIIDLSSITSSPSADSQGVLVGTNTIQWLYQNSNAIPTGGTIVLQYNATVPPRGGLFTNTATTLQYSSLPGDVPGERIYPPGSDPWTVITPGTDLTKVTLNTDIDVPSPGGTVRYRITIENSGAMDLDPVKLIDTLPDGLTYIPLTSNVNATPMEPNTLEDNPNGSQSLTWNNINLNTPIAMSPGQFYVVEFWASVDHGRVGTFINEATVIATAQGVGNVTDTDDSPVGVKGPAINIVKSVRPPYGKVGFDNEYTLKITNTGEVLLNPVSITDILPKGLTYSDIATPVPDSVVVNADGTTTMVWNNIGLLAVGESKFITFSAKFNGLETKCINYASTEGWPPNGDSVTDDDQVEIIKNPGGSPKENLRIITKGYMKRCDLCYNKELLVEARELITNQNVLDEDDTCCRPDDIIEELKIEIVKKDLDNDPRYIRALKLLDDADELCREADAAYEKGNYGQAQRLTKEKCESLGEAIRLMVELLSENK